MLLCGEHLISACQGFLHLHTALWKKPAQSSHSITGNPANTQMLQLRFIEVEWFP